MSKTVNFIEAINSGRNFRVKGWSDGNYYTLDEHRMKGRNSLTFYNGEFELEEKIISLSESEVREVLETRHYSGDRYTTVESILRELGF